MAENRSEPLFDARKPDRKMTDDEVDEAVRRRIERERIERIRDAAPRHREDGYGEFDVRD